MKTHRPALVAALLLATLPAAYGATIFGELTDRELSQTLALGTVTGATLRAGAAAGSDPGGRDALFVFQLPDFGAVVNPFLTADLGLYLNGVSGTPTFNVDIYSLGLQTSSTITVGSGVLSTNRFYESNTLDSGAALIQQDFSTPLTNTAGQKNTNGTGDAALLAILNSLYAGGTGAGKYLVIRANPDDGTPVTAIGYNYRSADDGGAGTTFDPVITYTAIPEPAAFALLGSVGFLALLRRRR